MAKTSNKDADLLAMIRRHRELYDEYGRIIEDRDDSRVDELLTRITALAFEITATPAHTARGLAGKRRVIRLAALGDNQGFFDWLLARDAERISAAKTTRRSRRAAGTTESPTATA